MNTTPRVDLKMEVGAIEESVTVVGASPLLQTDRADTSKIIESVHLAEVPLGFNRKEASKLSQTLVRLAVDLGSFNNISDSDALEKLRSGILGETEPLKALGVVINDATLSAKLMQMGLAVSKSYSERRYQIVAPEDAADTPGTRASIDRCEIKAEVGPG